MPTEAGRAEAGAENAGVSGAAASTSRPVRTKWPVPLLLDETWLRARRAVVQELERRGLWPSLTENRAYLEGQVELGGRLQVDLLHPLLEPGDAAALGSEGIFGSANDRVRRRLPLALAFGYELGRVFHALSGRDPAERPDVASAGALFNVGIATF